MRLYIYIYINECIPDCRPWPLQDIRLSRPSTHILTGQGFFWVVLGTRPLVSTVGILGYRLGLMVGLSGFMTQRLD